MGSVIRYLAYGYLAYGSLIIPEAYLDFFNHKDRKKCLLYFFAFSACTHLRILRLNVNVASRHLVPQRAPSVLQFDIPAFARRFVRAGGVGHSTFKPH